MRILVTGATGVIGHRTIPLLLAAGHHVTAVARSSEGRQSLERAGAAATTLDLFDRVAAHQALSGHDVVINLATSVPRSSFRALLPGAWKEMDRLRTFASAVLVEAALANGVERFVQESFAPVYPDSGAHWIGEGIEPLPAHFNRSVLDAEASAMRFTQAGRTGVVLRFAYFYGPADPFARDLLRFVKRGFLPFFGRPEGYLSMVHHEDAAAAVLAALEVPRGTYNVVDDEPLTRRALGDELAAMLGVAPPKIPGPKLARLFGSMGEMFTRSLRISNRKLRSTSSFAPKYPNARAGMRAVLDSFARDTDGSVILTHAAR